MQNQEERKEIEVEIEIDLTTGEMLLSRDHAFVMDIVKQINPDDEGIMSCFIENKPKTVEDEINYKSFCG